MFIWNPGFCLQGTFVPYRCWVPVYFWKTFFYMCDWTLHCSIICDTICLYYSALDLLLTCCLHYWVLHDVNYIHWPSAPGTWYFMHVCVVFLRDVMIFTYYALSGNFIFMHVMPYISIWCQRYSRTTRSLGNWYLCASVLLFYGMSLILIYCELSRNLIFYARQCCIFLRDIIGVHLLWALRELEILCASVSFVKDMISSHTPVVTRNIHVLLMLFIYINTLFNMAVLYYVEWWCIFSSWIFTRNVYILTNMVLSFFDDCLVSAGYIWMWTCLSAKENWVKRV